jgi:MFS family permease
MKTRAMRADIVLISGCFLVGLSVAIYFDAFERVAAFVAAHQFWQWEEIFVAFAIAGLVATAIAPFAILKTGRERERALSGSYWGTIQRKMPEARSCS